MANPIADSAAATVKIYKEKYKKLLIFIEEIDYY
jgi:hypothetical protein